MIVFTITIESKDFVEFSRTLNLSHKHAESAFGQVITAARPRIQGKMQAPANVPDLPFVWSFDPAANAVPNQGRAWK